MQNRERRKGGATVLCDLIKTSVVLLAVGLLLVGRAEAQIGGGGKASVSAVLNVDALSPGRPAALAVVIDIPPGLHAQSNAPLDPNLVALQVTLDAGPVTAAGDPQYPEGEIKEYPSLGTLSVYEGKATVFVPLAVPAGTAAGPVTIAGKVRYQLCDDKVCFMPVTTPFSVVTTVGPDPGTAINGDVFAGYVAPAGNATTTAPATAPAAGGNEATGSSILTRGGDRPEDWSVPVAFGAALVAGLLFNVMPCVLPVLPLKIVGFYEAAGQSRARSFMLGLVFSLGVVAVFAALGVLVLVLGVISWGSMFGNPWFVWGLVALLVAMSAGLFGAFAVTLPGGTYNFAPRHDTVGGNFLWGGFTAVLATPCTAPLLPALLLWAASKPPVVGVPAMVMVGVGMALPYLVLSAVPEVARRFPRTGPWAELFKQMMGFLMLAAAVYFAAGRLVPGPGFWWLVVATMAVAGLFLMARTVQLTKNAFPVGVSAMIAVAMVGGTFWWTARVTGALRPVGAAGIAGGGWQPYSDALFAAERSGGDGPVLVKFTANWCATCQVIEGTVFQDPAVWRTIADRGVTPIKVDLTDTDAPGADLLLKLNPAGGIPLTAVWFPGRDEPVQLASIYTSGDLLAVLAGGAGGRTAGATQVVGTSAGP